MITAKKPNHLDATTTGREECLHESNSHANTPLAQSERAYYLSYFINGYVGLCMALYGYVGLCRAVYGYIGLCRAVYGYVGPYRAVYGYVGLCMAKYGYLGQFMAM